MKIIFDFLKGNESIILFKDYIGLKIFVFFIINYFEVI